MKLTPWRTSILVYVQKKKIVQPVGCVWMGERVGHFQIFSP